MKLLVKSARGCISVNLRHKLLMHHELRAASVNKVQGREALWQAVQGNPFKYVLSIVLIMIGVRGCQVLSTRPGWHFLTWPSWVWAVIFFVSLAVINVLRLLIEIFLLTRHQGDKDESAVNVHGKPSCTDTTAVERGTEVGAAAANSPLQRHRC